MRVAKQEESCFLVGTFLLEIFKINLVGIEVAYKWIFNNVAALIADAAEEAVINRSLNKHFFAREGKSTNGAAYSRHNT